MKEADIRKFFTRLGAKNPAPKGELNYKNSYTLLVAVVLSAQSTDVGVNKATKPLFKVVDNPEKMVKLGIEKLKSYIKTIGLYNTKAKNIIRASRLEISVLPTPVGPIIKIFFGNTSSFIASSSC